MSLQPVRLVIGFSPGSLSERIARSLTDALARTLDAPIRLEHMPGENGSLAARTVAASVPDGRTLFIATLGTHALAPNLPRSPGYDARRDFDAVSLIAQAPLLLACHPSVAASSTAALIALARAQPGGITYATSALGGCPHLAAELFQTMAGVHLRHVRYAQTERLYADLEAGRVALSFNNIMSMLPHCRRGVLRALAVSSTARSDAAPGVPTLDESGLPGYEVTNWVGLVAPRGTPPAVLKRASDAVAAAVRTPDVRAEYVRSGVVPRGSDPETFAEFIAHEIARWRPAVQRFSDESMHVD